MHSIQELKQILREGESRSLHERAERTYELESLLNLKSLWDIFPDFGSYYSSQETPILEALEDFTQELWRQALRCYIDSSYLASIISSACAIESTLKHALESEGIRYDNHAGLGTCIKLCEENQILPQDKDDAVIIATQSVNNARNDIVHANIPRIRPNSILYSEGEEHELSDIGISGIQSVEPFKNLARDTIDNTEKLLDYFNI